MIYERHLELSTNRSEPVPGSARRCLPRRPARHEVLLGIRAPVLRESRSRRLVDPGARWSRARSWPRRAESWKTGFSADGDAIPLGEVRQKGGKVVHAWAVRGDADPSRLVSNPCQIEWPRGSGRIRTFPEVDRAGWYSLDEARERLLPAQAAFLERLAAVVRSG
jgi:hypothetical protein